MARAVAWRVTLAILIYSIGSYAQPLFFTVCTECFLKTIADALVQAKDNDTTIKVLAGTFPTGYLKINKSITLNFEDGVILSSNGSLPMDIDARVIITGAVHIIDIPININSELEQIGDINMSLSNMTIGITIAPNALWRQSGLYSVTLVSASALQAVQTQDKAQWLQTGKLIVSGTSVTADPAISLVGGGTWNQTGDADFDFSGPDQVVQLTDNSKWIQSGNMRMNVTSATGVMIQDSANWVQNGQVTMDLMDSSTGVALQHEGVWYQAGEVTFNFISGENLGIACNTTGTWSRTGAVYFEGAGNHYAGGCPSASISTTPSPDPFATLQPPIPSRSSPAFPSYTASPSATPSPSPSPFRQSDSPYPTSVPSNLPITSPVPSSSPQYLVSNTTSVAGAIPVLHFNLTAPDIRLLPKDPRGKALADAAVGIGLLNGNIREFGGDEDEDERVVRYGVVESGKWEQVDDTVLGSTSSYLFRAVLRVFDGVNDTLVDDDSDGGNETRIEVQFYLFESERNVSVGDLEFNALPAFAKFSLRVFHWPWSPHHAIGQGALELRMAITPSFSSFTQHNNTPSVGVTSFALNGQTTSSSYTGTQTVLKLIDTVDLDGHNIGAGQGISFSLDTDKSLLVLRFRHFNTSLDYDPDLGVILGAPRGKSSGTDNTGLIVGVAVAVPLAVVGVVAVIVAAFAVGWLRRKRVQTGRSSVNFDFGPALVDSEL